MVWCGVGGTGGRRLGCLGRQAGFGWIAEARETGKGPEPGHRLALDPAVKSPVTIPPERAMNPFLRSALFLPHSSGHRACVATGNVQRRASALRATVADSSTRCFA